MKNKNEETKMDLDYEKYTNESLWFMYSEACRYFEETTRSFREIVNKSYILIGITYSIMAVLISEIIKTSEIINLYSLLFLFLLFPTIIITFNLLPTNFITSGAQPKLMQHDYFESSKKNQYKKLLIQRIEDCQIAIETNGAILNKRAKRLKYAILLSFFSFVMTVILWSFNLCS
jgi:hypothetical protein